MYWHNRCASMAILASALLGSTACSNLGQAVLEAARVAWSTGKPQAFDKVALDPRYVYLEVHAPNASALMALAYADGTPTVETWMSSTQELLRTEQGRFRGAQGVPGMWADVLWQNLPTEPTTNPETPSTASRAKALATVAVRDTTQGLHTAAVPCLPVNTNPLSSPSALLKRVMAAHGPLEWQACQAKAGGLRVFYSTVVRPAQPNQNSVWVYGQHCVGGQTVRIHCIEYWRRTAGAEKP